MGVSAICGPSVSCDLDHLFKLCDKNYFNSNIKSKNVFQLYYLFNSNEKRGNKQCLLDTPPQGNSHRNVFASFDEIPSITL